MKSLLLAAALAVAFTPVATLPSKAASLTITTENGGYRHHDRNDGWHRDRGWHRGWEARHHGWRHHGWDRREARNDDCVTKTTRSYHHHRVVTKTERVCR